MKENKRVAKAAGTVGIFTLLSRIMGFIRDMVMACFFGSGMLTDAFIAAFRLPNLMRRLFAEGSLVVSFVPVFTDYLENKGRDEAFKLAGSAFRLLSVLLAVTAVVGILLAPFILCGLAPGFGANPGKVALAVLLTKIVFPYVFFICLVALCMGILNALGHFAAPAFAPVMLNIAMISSMLIAAAVSPDKVFGIKALAFGVLAGGVLQLGLQIPFLIHYGFRFWEKTSFFHPGLKKIGKMMLPAILGAGVYQVNIVAGTIIASLLPEGSITWLYYADRVFQFPLGIFAISMGTAILPSLSRQAAAGDIDGLKGTFTYGLRFVFFITLPATAGLIVLREPIVALLFQRGAFGSIDSVMTANALLYYSAGLCFVSAVRVAAPVFYARQDAKTPVRIAIISIIANILLSLCLMGPMKHSGLALATSLASLLNLVLMIGIIRHQLGRFGGGAVIVSILRSSICSVGMGVAVHVLALYLIPAYNTDSGLKFVLGMGVCIGAGVFIYTILALVLKSPELKSILSMFRKRGESIA